MSGSPCSRAAAATGVIHGPARQSRGGELPQQLTGIGSRQESGCRKVVGLQRNAAAGLSCRGGGNRVSTEKFHRGMPGHPPMAGQKAVAGRAMERVPALHQRERRAGVDENVLSAGRQAATPDRVFVELRPAGRKEQQPVGLDELVGGDARSGIAAPSREISTSPAVMPTWSRIDLGITRRLALSMVVRIIRLPLRWYRSGGRSTPSLSASSAYRVSRSECVRQIPSLWRHGSGTGSVPLVPFSDAAVRCSHLYSSRCIFLAMLSGIWGCRAWPVDTPGSRRRSSRANCSRFTIELLPSLISGGQPLARPSPEKHRAGSAVAVRLAFEAYERISLA